VESLLIFKFALDVPPNKIYCLANSLPNQVVGSPGNSNTFLTLRSPSFNSLRDEEIVDVKIEGVTPVGYPQVLLRIL
jgi:hypothetical protein